MSSFGRLFRVTTFGESHCKGVGCIVDGVPPCMSLTEEDIQPQLTRRRPGQSRLTTPRDESDLCTIMSGTENGITLGTPIGIFVPNNNVRPKDYTEMQQIPRPGHGDYSYRIKYGINAISGGGRASARETIGRVAAGAIAEKWLYENYGTTFSCWVTRVGTVDIPDDSVMHQDGRPWSRDEVDTYGTIEILRDPSTNPIVTVSEVPDEAEREDKQRSIYEADEDQFVLSSDNTKPAYREVYGANRIFTREGELLLDIDADTAELWRTGDVVPTRCPHAPSACRMSTLIRVIKSESDSTGGILTAVIHNPPPALGEPVFDKLEAALAHAMLSLPATKGFEIGSGFEGTKMRGSVHNDPYKGYNKEKKILETETNNAGGTYGGISSGEDIVFRVAVKAVSTIGKAQSTATWDGSKATLEARGRHDPCVLPRAGPLVEAMAALVIADYAMIQRARVGGGGYVHPTYAPILEAMANKKE